MSAESQEIEFKLACGAQHALALRKHLVLEHPLAGAPYSRKKLVNVYFDTPDFALRRQRIALRLRRIDRHWVQTLKASLDDAEGKGDGISIRREWEMPVAGPALELQKLADTPLKAALKIAGGAENLMPLFRVEFLRDAWTVKPFPRYAPDFVAEIAFDRGRIVAGARTGRISEIEIELKSGHIKELQYLAHVLMRDLKIREEPRSKAKRGYALLRGE